MTRHAGGDPRPTAFGSLGRAQLEQTHATIAQSEVGYRALTESMPQLVWIIDDQIRVQYVNGRWLSYTGLTFEPGMASKTESIVHPDDIAALTAAYEAVRERNTIDCELRLRRQDGVYLWHLLRAVPLSESATSSICTATDIESHKSTQATLAQTIAELEYRADHDPLTGLSNRKKLIERLDRMIVEAQDSGTNVVVLHLDIDHFRPINDTLGHQAGDELLIETASRIRANLRDNDIASRLGGDEFVLVCSADGVVDAAAIADRLRVAVRVPITLGGKSVVVASSIGISLYPHDGDMSSELMQKADAAMYAAKQGGRDAWAFYSAQTPVTPLPGIELEVELRAAIAGEQFVVHYQPVIDIKSGRPVGAEALVRWQHPERGLLPPSEFIAFAENHGMIAAIGELVLGSVCAQVRSLQLHTSDDFSVAVNVSANQFTRPSFVGSIASAIAAHGIDARHLEIEITESVVMGNSTAVIATLKRLQVLGVRLSIDDFGTGYSSLAYIKTFPIHTLKIDRSFIRDVATNFTDAAIAKTIVTLARSLGMRTIAEGIETVDQLDCLRAFGADCFQGFLVSRALPSAEFEAFLSERLAPGRLAPTAPMTREESSPS